MYTFRFIITLFCVWMFSCFLINGEAECSDFLSQEQIGALGHLDSEFKADSDIWIVHIKDAHCNFQAQLNSYKIFEKLIEDYQFSVICMEGASATLSLADISSFPDYNTKKDVTLQFLKKGSINGAEYLSILNPDLSSVEGVENHKTYIKNYNAFFKSLSFRKKSSRITEDLKLFLHDLKPIYFSDDLFSFDSEYQKFKREEIPLFQLFDSLKFYIDKFQIGYTSYKNLSKLKDALDIKNSFNSTKAEEEIEQIVKSLLSYSSSKEKQLILNTRMKYQFHQISLGEFHQFVLNRCDDLLIEMDEYPNFAKFVAYSKKLKNVQNEKLFAEIDECVKVIKKSLYKKDIEAEIDSLYQLSIILEKSFNLSLAQKESFELNNKILYAKNLKTFLDRIAQTHDLPNSLNDTNTKFLENALFYVIEYYTTAQQRNEYLVENTIKIMKSKNLKRSILYTGGFHTDGICDLLREKNISYSVITPKTVHSSNEDSYLKLLTNIKDPFLNTLENNLLDFQVTGKSMLSLASKLVPPSEALIDQRGTSAFRSQLKTLYTAEAIKRAVREIDDENLLLVANLDEKQLAELSDKVKQILVWSNKNFSNLDGFSLIRKNDNTDLKISIDNQSFYLRNLISSKRRKQLAGKKISTDPDKLITLRINGDPLSIYSTPSDINPTELSYEHYTDTDLNNILTAFQNKKKITEEELINLLGTPPSTSINIIKILMESQLLTINIDATYSLNNTKSETLLTANRLFAYKSDSWSSITDISSLSLPEKFRVFLEKHKITEIEIPSDINFSSLVFMLDRVPAQISEEDFDSEFQITAQIPNDLSSAFIFKKEILMGDTGFRLTVLPDTESTTNTIQKEHALLMGENYTDTLKKQLFGFFPKKAYSIAIFEKTDNHTIVLDTPMNTDKKTITWISSDLPTAFWREIEKTTVHFGRDFRRTGGLMFGTQIGDKYVISKIVPLKTTDLDYREDGSFSVKQSRFYELLDKHATGNIKLLGRYSNHSPQRQLDGITPGVSEGDVVSTLLLNNNNPKIVDNPIGIMFEPILPEDTLGIETLDSLYIDPKEVEAFFHTIEDRPQILHQIPALDFVSPTLDAVRNLYLRSTKDAAYPKETTLAEFHRSPENRSFVMIPSKETDQGQIDTFIQYFRAIQKEFETYSDISKLVIKGGMSNSAHVNRDDKVIEINVEMIQYPLLTKYLAIPHETNHLNIGLEKDIEEVIVIMLDLYRLSELAIKDHDIALSFLRQLDSYETPYQNQKLFTNIVREIIDSVTTKKQSLSIPELFNYTKKYISSDPELTELCSAILSKKTETELTNIFSTLHKKTLKDVPAFQFGEMSYITFDEEQLNNPVLLGQPNIIDFNKLTLEYLSSSEYIAKQSKLSTTGQTDSNNVSGFFDQRSGKIYLNKDSQFHLNKNDNFAINPDKLLSTITKERTLYFLHKNPDILNNFLSIIDSDEETKENILLYFYRLTTNKMLSSITPQVFQEISNSPVVSTDGRIDYRKIMQEIIGKINGYDTFNELLTKYEAIAGRLETENRPVPENLHERIAFLKTLTKNMKPFFDDLNEARDFIQYKDPSLSPCFSVPALSIIHVMYEGDQIVSNEDETPDNLLKFPTPPTFNDRSDQETEQPAKPVQSINPSAITPGLIPMSKFNEFLNRVRILKEEPPLTKISYKKALAKQGAQEFYDFLQDKHQRDSLSGLPAQINVVNLFTGTPEFAKDFLDHFRELDQNQIFYNRLRYNLVSHSQNSKFLLENLKRSGFFEKYSDVVRFNFLDNLDELSVIENQLLVHTYGDINLFSDSIVIEKRGDDFFEIKGQPVLKDSAKDISPDKLNDYINNPSFSSLEEIPDDIMEWQETSVPIDIDQYPFAQLLRAYTQKYLQKRLILHPSLIETVKKSLKVMEQNNGGYFQFYGNGFNSIEQQLQHPHLQPTALDGPLMTGSKGMYVFETLRDRLAKISNGNSFPYELDKDRLTEKAVKNIFKDISISALDNLSELFKIRNRQNFKTNNRFVFNQLISELKTNAFLPNDMPVPLLTDPDQKDDFIYSIEQALKQSFPFSEIIDQAIHESENPDTLTISDMIEPLKKESPCKFLSDSYLTEALTKIARFSKSTQNFYLRLDSTPIKDVSAPVTATIKKDTIQIRTLSASQFENHVDDIKRNHRHLFYDDARGLANPVTGEILVNIDHPDHLDDNGKTNKIAIKQTIIHERTHMLAFSKQDLLKEIASNLQNNDEKKRQLLTLFYKLSLNETIDLITQEHKDSIKANPLWSIDGEISYERIISEIMSIINQYQILPALTTVFSSIQNKLAQKGKTTPEKLERSYQHLRQILKKQQPEIIESIKAIHAIRNIDNRITENLLYNKKLFKQSIRLSDIDTTSLPLPSAPVQTVFLPDELDDIITGVWSDIGNKNIEHGKDFTLLKGLRLNDFQTALYDLNQLQPSKQETIDSLTASVSFWEDALENQKIHIYPTSPGTYTIKGTHFIHLTKEGDIIIPQGYFEYLKENNRLAQALVALGTKFLDGKTDPTPKLFDGDSIKQIEENLYNKYLNYHSFIPIVDSVLKLYGLKLDDISQKSLETIITNHEKVLKLPGIQTHLEKVHRIIEKTTSIKYTPASVVEAFSVYANSLSSQEDIQALQETVSVLSDTIVRETSTPVIFLIDQKVATGPVSPQNFAIRENLKRFRNEIEQLEKRNVIIIAVDLKGEPSGKIKEDMNNSLLRRGATTDDFDYVISYKNTSDLLDALKAEYPNLSENQLKANLKILAIKNSPLIDFAQSHEFRYQSIDDSYLINQYSNNKGVFLIDYLRSLGLNDFITDSSTDLSKEIRGTLHINTIDPSIDTTGIPEKLVSLINKFTQLLSENSDISDFNQAKRIFLEQTPGLKKEEFTFITPFLESQFFITRTADIFKGIQTLQDSQTNLLFNVYSKLQQAFSDKPDSTYSDITDNLFDKLTTNEFKLLNTQNKILAGLKKSGKSDTAIPQKELKTLFLYTFINENILKNTSEFFAVEKKILSEGKLHPVSYNTFINVLKENAIPITPDLTNHFRVEVAPRKIQNELHNLLATQKIFEQSA